LSDYHVIVEGQTGADDTIAAQVAHALIEAYPGHPWHVEAKQGVVIIKHMRISGKQGMIRHQRSIYSASDLKKVAIAYGGEFLERAGLARGVYSGETVRKVEGVLTKDLVL
jgi:hypothetical protein